MAISNEIEKLERRWQQTSGLVFAPLAEAYRKVGLQSRALEILEQGLALHPEYGPALIVRGRCHLDAGTLDEAELAFQQALARDPMDPIALRGLAEVYERTGRVREAVERLQLVVDLDPRNSEARQGLERLLSTPPEPLPVGVEEPEAPVVAAEAPPARTETPSLSVLEELSFEVVNLEAEEIAPAAPSAGAEPAAEPALEVETFGVEPVDAAVWRVTEAHEAGTVEAFVPTSQPAEPASVPEPVRWTPAPEPMAGPEPAPEPAGEAGAEPEVRETPLPGLETAPALESATAALIEGLTGPEPMAPAVEEAPRGELPGASALEATVETVEAAVESPVEPAEPVVAEPVAAEYASTMEPSYPEPSPPAAGDEPPAAEEAPTLIVTESMAELFLKQGHRELALAVYRQLRERGSRSASLDAAISRLERELTPEPAPERRPYAAAETGGRSVESLLRAVLDAEPPVVASTVLPPAIEPTSGEPTRVAEAALPLSAVFGDEPVVAPKQAPEPSGEPEPSYDEFFGAATGGESAVPGAARGGEGEDLRQFNEWLKGLKR